MRFRVSDNKTGKEADAYEIALHEEWANHLCYCDMEGFAITENGHLMLADECGKSVYCDADRFKVVFEDEQPHNLAKEAIKEIREMCWGYDILHPSCPEYREHHEQMQKIMGLCDSWLKKLEGGEQK